MWLLIPNTAILWILLYSTLLWAMSPYKPRMYVLAFFSGTAIRWAPFSSPSVGARVGPPTANQTSALPIICQSSYTQAPPFYEPPFPLIWQSNSLQIFTGLFFQRATKCEPLVKNDPWSPTNSNTSCWGEGESTRISTQIEVWTPTSKAWANKSWVLPVYLF